MHDLRQLSKWISVVSVHCKIPSQKEKFISSYVFLRRGDNVITSNGPIQSVFIRDTNVNSDN